MGLWSFLGFGGKPKNTDTEYKEFDARGCSIAELMWRMQALHDINCAQEYHRLMKHLHTLPPKKPSDEDDDAAAEEAKRQNDAWVAESRKLQDNYTRCIVTGLDERASICLKDHSLEECVKTDKLIQNLYAKMAILQEMEDVETYIDPYLEIIHRIPKEHENPAPLQKPISSVPIHLQTAADLPEEPEVDLDRFAERLKRSEHEFCAEDRRRLTACRQHYMRKYTNAGVSPQDMDDKVLNACSSEFLQFATCRAAAMCSREMRECLQGPASREHPSMCLALSKNPNTAVRNCIAQMEEILSQGGPPSH